MDVIVCHTNADFDCLSSMVGVQKLFPSAVMVFPGSQEKPVRDFLTAFPIEFAKTKDIDLSKIEKLIIVDTKDPARIGEFKDAAARGDVTTIIYDHHQAGKRDIHGAVERVERVGASATIITELLREKNIRITAFEATVMCLGIYEETGSMRFTSTTERDLLAAAYLIKRGANLNIVSNYIRPVMTRDDLALLNDLVASLTEMDAGGLRVKVGAAARENYYGDAAHMAHAIMDMEDIDAVVVILELQGKIYLIGRSRTTEFNVAKLMRLFGGDGHPTAASATLSTASASPPSQAGRTSLSSQPSPARQPSPASQASPAWQPSLSSQSGTTIDALKDEVILAARGLVKPRKTVSDIMTSPVVVIRSGATVKEAGALLTRYEINVLPVIGSAGGSVGGLTSGSGVGSGGGKDLYEGIITREAVEKALFHGFSCGLATEFMTTDAECASPDSPIGEVERIMIEHNQRFMPVIEGGRVVGAVTRTDILRNLYEDYIRRSRIVEPGGEVRSRSGKNVRTLLKERFPAFAYDIFLKAGRMADSLDMGVYLVGGCVRDMLRAEQNLDIDLVVEGDGIRFASEFAKILHGRVKTHGVFKTAKIYGIGIDAANSGGAADASVNSEKANGADSAAKADSADGTGATAAADYATLVIDVATARTEYYEEPAALPKVESSSIKKDLYRRDFTINSLAVRLNSHRFGELIDYFGAQRDLKEKVIRVLHNLSFIEDPTRAFRAVRFAWRFGFTIGKHTEKLIKSALKFDLFKKLSGARLFDELMLTFGEMRPAGALKKLSALGLLKVIHEELVFTRRLEALFDRVHDVISWYELLFLDEKLESGTLHLMALISQLSQAARETALERLSTPLPVKHRVLDALVRSKNAAMAVDSGSIRPENAVSVYHALHGLTLEALLFMIADADKGAAARGKTVSRYLLELRNVRPTLDGEDIKALGIKPGPVFSEIFDRLLDARLRGEIASREDEVEFVRGNFGVR